MRKLILIGVAALALVNVAAASAKTITIHIENLAHFKQGYLHKVERAIEWQINHDFRQAWHTPRIQFNRPSTRFDLSPHVWNAQLESSQYVIVGFGEKVRGVHNPISQGKVFIEVAGHSPTNQPMSEILDHEVMEGLEDPTGMRTINGHSAEVCDPVEGLGGYTINGVRVEDFITPRWFGLQDTGLYDHLGHFDTDFQTVPVPSEAPPQ